MSTVNDTLAMAKHGANQTLQIHIFFLPPETRWVRRVCAEAEAVLSSEYLSPSAPEVCIYMKDHGQFHLAYVPRRELCSPVPKRCLKRHQSSV